MHEILMFYQLIIRADMELTIKTQPRYSMDGPQTWNDQLLITGSVDRWCFFSNKANSSAAARHFKLFSVVVIQCTL